MSNVSFDDGRVAVDDQIVLLQVVVLMCQTGHDYLVMPLTVIIL